MYPKAHSLTQTPRGGTYRLEADDIDGLSQAMFSTEVTSNVPVIAERARYFDYSGRWSGGHDAIGVTLPSDTWYFAEG